MKFRVKQKRNGRWVVQGRWWFIWVDIPSLTTGDKDFEWEPAAQEYKRFLEENS